MKAIIPRFDKSYCPEGYMRVQSGEMEGMLFKPSFFTLESEDRDRICNGIGAATGLTKHFPNTIWGLDIKIAGDCHDYDYYVGGSKHDKEIADKVFLHNMRVLIRKGCWLLRIPRNSRANKYYLAVAVGGSKHFSYHD